MQNFEMQDIFPNYQEQETKAINKISLPNNLSTRLLPTGFVHTDHLFLWTATHWLVIDNGPKIIMFNNTMST